MVLVKRKGMRSNQHIYSISISTQVVVVGTQYYLTISILQIKAEIEKSKRARHQSVLLTIGGWFEQDVGTTQVQAVAEPDATQVFDNHES